MKRIAIIGSPNVGKSTFFNRLVGKKSAIVHNKPGVTRDRREGKASLGFLNFIIVDTPGLEETGFKKSRSSALESLMMKQTTKAVDESDLVLFMVDAKQGITNIDKFFSRWLRTFNKKILLIANKAEGKLDKGKLQSFLELGFEEPIPISAEHGEGMNYLFDALSADDFVSEEEPENKEDAPRIAIVGRPNVGKSTLFNQILGEERVVTSDIPGTTRDAIEVPGRFKEKDFILIDTAGLRKQSNITESLEKMAVDDTKKAVQFSHIVVIVLDAETALEKQDLSIADYVIEEGRGIVIALNKWDKIENPERYLKDFHERLKSSLSQINKIPVITISALSGKNVPSLIKEIFAVYERWNNKLSTSALNRWLEQVILEHSPPMVKGRPTKLRYMTQTKIRPPSFIIFGNHTPTPSYTRYLTSKLRDRFDFAGVPIRINVRKNKNPYDA